jgi:4-carboxymuconolactone decarboxylase
MASKRPKARLKTPPDHRLNKPQRALRDEIMATRKGLKKLSGPFAVWLHAPELGNHAQRLGAHCRYKTSLPPRLSEFAILTTARMWRAQYEWNAHALMAERAGVSIRTIADLRAGRYPKSARPDERALYDFIAELYRTRRVSDRNYARVFKIVGTAGMVEFVGILGYYALVSMTLNVFSMPVEPGQTTPFKEPPARR